MELIRITQRAMLLALLALGLVFGGCASGGIFGGGDDDNDDSGYDNSDYERDSDDDRITEVRGRVERVDTRDSIIYVEPSGVYRSNLRNEDDEVALHYDSSTEIEYDGRTYEPSALEVGDRIVAEVDDTGSRLYARDIEVTFDVTSADRDDDSRYEDDREDTADRNDDDDVAEVRGKVRWLDQNRKVLEIEGASWGWSAGNRDRDDDVVEIHYDSGTTVEYDGRQYKPANLERGDEVQIELRDLGTRYLADEIVVIASVRD